VTSGGQDIPGNQTTIKKIIKGRLINPVWYVILVALVIRSAIPLYAEIFSDDRRFYDEIYSQQYVEPARNLIKSGEFTLKGAPEIYRSPGYPLLLIPGILLGHAPLITISMQILLSCLTVYLVFRMSIALFGEGEIAVLCAALYAIDPLSVIFSGLIMPETLFTFALSLFLLCLVRYLKEDSLFQLVLSAVALASAVYVQATAYFLPVWMTLVLIFGALKRRSGIHLLHALIFLVISMSLIAAWQIRNRVETGYSGFSTVFDKSLYYAQAASVLAKLEGKSDFRQLWGSMEKKVNERSSQLSEQFRYMRQEGIQITLAHPFAYAQIHFWGILRTLLGGEAHTYIRVLELGSAEDRKELESGQNVWDLLEGDYGKLSLPLIIMTIALGLIVVVVYLFAAVALFSRNFLTSMPVICLLSVIVYWLGITGGPHGYSRYRLAVMPVVCLIAGYGLCLILRRLRRYATSREVRLTEESNCRISSSQQ
jgi:4-amino-4-deoxy-L-arabinose transferase-like glycosyltransferase